MTNKMNSIQNYYQGNLSWIKDKTILLTKAGSQAYGTNMPESDIDVKGVCVPPKEYYFGFLNCFEQAEQSKPYDLVIYELRKFMRLAADNNPNILDVLFCDDNDILFINEQGEKLRKNRDLFLSRKCRFSYAGFAVSQLKRIKSHKHWLLEPLTHKPTRVEFGLMENIKMSQSDLGAMDKLVQNNTPLDERVMLLYQKEQAYLNAMRSWDQYQTWKETRNEKRAGLEAKFGYDTKHALHLVRLMRMCREILTTGQVIVKRPDAEELLAIRAGAWTYDQLIEWAEKEEKEMELLYNTSPLPKEPDRKMLDQLCVELVEDML